MLTREKNMATTIRFVTDYNQSIRKLQEDPTMTFPTEEITRRETPAYSLTESRGVGAQIVPDSSYLIGHAQRKFK
jgi:hypothetical protein